MNFNINLSIKKLTLIIFVILYFLFFILMSINLYSYSSYENKKTDKILKNYTITLSEQITEKLDGILDVSKYPLIIPEIDSIHSILKNNSNFSISEYNYLRYLCSMMLIQNNSINGAFIYDLKGRGVFSNRNSNNDVLLSPYNQIWYSHIVNSPNSTEFISDIDSSNIFQLTSENDDDMIALTRKIIDLSNQETTGIMLLTLPKNELIDISELEFPYENQVSSLYDTNGKLIFTNDDKFNYIPTYEFLSSSSLEPELSKAKVNSTKYIITSNKLSTSGWILINAVPESSAYHINSLYLYTFIISIIFFLAMFISLYKFLSKRVFIPIKTLINNMDKNVEHNLSYDLKYDKNDEIGILFNSYNEMKSRINDLININYKNQIEQKELELKQLQIQINPHFIYNTLESIHMMAEINDDFETSTMAQSFGAIIRYSMNRKINTVLLKDEIAIIDNYIYLQKIRFDQLFIIENKISDDVLNCKIIKMIIQPLIENSINHGLSQCSSNGKIIIQGDHFEDKLLITISDNGIGMSDEKVKALNDYVNDKNNDFNGIALRNVNRRLKLKYGDEYGLIIYSVENKGTSVVLTLPYIPS